MRDEERGKGEGGRGKGQLLSFLSPFPFSLSPSLSSLLVASLLGFALFAPHSIAVAQGFWGLGLLFWIVRLIVRPRPRFFRTPLDFVLLGFVTLTFISSLFSYDQSVSLRKMLAVSLFTIVYLVAENVNSKRLVRALALCLVASCMINVFYTLGERLMGRGIKVEGLTATSPLRAAKIQDGDTLLEVDNRALRKPEELVAALDATGANASVPARVRIYRFEWVGLVDVPRGQLLDGATPLERLGVGNWSRGRDHRASGFYGHYVTYAEVLQLIMSLAFGFLIALPRKRSTEGALFLVAVTLLGVALLMTLTRASWLAFLISAFVIMLAGANRRTLLIVVVCALPLIFAGLFVLKQKRNVGFFDRTDGSTQWRETVWREGTQLLVSKPRHLLVGVGMDSIKNHWREWGLFDEGRLPPGHMHSNPLQLALERGIPALLMWLALMFLYARMLWRLARKGRLESWIERGLVLGALGGLAGFFASGLVHYNFGDSEVVMIFYFIMGLCLVVERQTKEFGGSQKAGGKG